MTLLSQSHHTDKLSIIKHSTKNGKTHKLETTPHWLYVTFPLCVCKSEKHDVV